MDEALPTVATEPVLITGAIYAKEVRDEATLDLPGAYLWADQNELLRMVLRGQLEELMVFAAPELLSLSSVNMVNQSYT